MGLLVECPGCKLRNSPKNKTCVCGVLLKRPVIYWIEYSDNQGKRRRQKIGYRKETAIYQLNKMLSQNNKEHFIKKPNCIGHIYFILCESSTLIKIGYSGDYKKRFNSLILPTVNVCFLTP